MSQRITQQQLESYLWGAAVLLRGTIDAGDYKQFIFPLLFYKRICDVFDEETQTALAESGGDAEFAAYPENHRFQVPSEAHWREVRQAATNVGQAIQSAMRAIETANPDKLCGIFGDAQWTNKDRLPDAMLRDLIEHFSTLDLTLANLPEDELGQGYEYLIKKFADDSGHTAAEFYTNRTVVHLMTEMLQPQPGESIYDPTCGSGGMLLSSIAKLRRQNKEWRNVRLYGQERNLMTSSIARMNCFLHGIEDFQIVRGDTLSEPKFVQGDRLMQFDVVLANPPYSIKQWDREKFAADPWGRNVFGTPPQGRADYAFWQHILASMAPETGRSAILFPHGVLFRQEEAEMRRKLIEADLIECVLGLGPNLFYNSPMEACVAICRTEKPQERKGRILFINAVNEVNRERAQSFLTNEHIERITKAYKDFTGEPGFARVATLAEIRAREGNLSIPLYVEPSAGGGAAEVPEVVSVTGALNRWLGSRVDVAEALAQVLPGTTRPTLQAHLRGTNASNWFKSETSWPRVRFGDVVMNVNETESDPAEAGLERFIGLEHLEPGSLHIREWGNTADGTTFTRRCRPGQVLFGKRRAYQRKVAVAEFDAVVSGDIYVLQPKNDRLLPELLPFLCLTDGFYKHALGTSAGSLSPRTNWGSLADFEFSLPPIEEQRRIAEILWAAEEVWTAALSKTEPLRAYQRAFWAESTSKPSAITVKVGDVADVANGSTPSKADDRYWQDGTIPWLPTGKVHDRFIRSADKFITEVALKERKARVFPKGSVLVAMIGQGKTRGTAALMEIDASVNQNFACLIPREINNVYLFYALDFSYRRLRRSAHGSNQEALNCELVARYPIPFVTREEQEAIVSRLTTCETALGVTQGEAQAARELLSRLIEGLVGTR